MKQNEKLNNSKVLYENKGYSDSVSLSYYAMFLSAKALLIKKKL
ncbi:HEPN domain-containing protein [Methanosphaera sp. ISO3-F5]